MPKITVNPVIDIASNQEPSIYYMDEAVAIFNCVGSPEGVIRADRGSLALDNTTGSGYIKTTNNANTGWSVIASGGGGAAALPLNSVQYNNGGALGGIPSALYNVAGSLRTSFDLDKFQLGVGAGGSIVDDAGSRYLSFSGSGGTPKVSYFDITNTATLGTPTITVVSTDTNTGFGITSKGNGVIALTVGPTRFQATARAAPSGAAYYIRIQTPADTALPASTEATGIFFGGSSGVPPATVVRQFATGALTLQREYLFTAPTYAFVGASTITDAYTVDITNRPQVGTNATITNGHGLRVIGGITSPYGNGSEGFGYAAGPSGQFSTAVGNLAGGNGGDGQVSIGYNARGWTNTVVIGANSNSANGTGANVVVGESCTAGASANASIVLGNAATVNQANTMVAGGSANPIANIFFAKGVTNAAPTAFSINGTGGSGADIQGAGFNLTAGLGTGTGNPGTIGIRFGRPTASSSTINIQSDEIIFSYDSLNTIKQDFQIKTSTTDNTSAGKIGVFWNNATHATRGSVYQVETVSNAVTSNRALIVSRKTLTDAATNLFKVANPVLTGFSCIVSYEIFATNGTDVQVRHGVVRIASVNKAGAYTTDVVVISEGVAASSGTLTATFAATGAANESTIAVTPAGSLAETIYYITYTIENNSEQVVTIL